MAWPEIPFIAPYVMQDIRAGIGNTIIIENPAPIVPSFKVFACGVIQAELLIQDYIKQGDVVHEDPKPHLDLFKFLNDQQVHELSKSYVDRLLESTDIAHARGHHAHPVQLAAVRNDPFNRTGDNRLDFACWEPRVSSGDITTVVSPTPQNKFFEISFSCDSVLYHPCPDNFSQHSITGWEPIVSAWIEFAANPHYPNKRGVMSYMPSPVAWLRPPPPTVISDSEDEEYRDEPPPPMAPDSDSDGDWPPPPQRRRLSRTVTRDNFSFTNP